jgi:hypothetical protein
MSAASSSREITAMRRASPRRGSVSLRTASATRKPARQIASG